MSVDLSKLSFSMHDLNSKTKSSFSKFWPRWLGRIFLLNETNFKKKKRKNRNLWLECPLNNLFHLYVRRVSTNRSPCNLPSPLKEYLFLKILKMWEGGTYEEKHLLFYRNLRSKLEERHGTQESLKLNWAFISQGTPAHSSNNFYKSYLQMPVAFFNLKYSAISHDQKLLNYSIAILPSFSFLFPIWGSAFYSTIYHC